MELLAQVKGITTDNDISTRGRAALRNALEIQCMPYIIPPAPCTTATGEEETHKQNEWDKEN